MPAKLVCLRHSGFMNLLRTFYPGFIYHFVFWPVELRPRDRLRDEMNAVTVSTPTPIRSRTSESRQLRGTRLVWTGILGFSAVLGCLSGILGWVFSIEAVVGM